MLFQTRIFFCMLRRKYAILTNIVLKLTCAADAAHHHGIRLIMSRTNDISILKQQYATADHLNFSKVEKLEYIDSLAVTNIDDMVEYICSLPSMTSLKNVPKQVIKDILAENTTNGILNVPKEYGMFISS